MNEKRIPKLIIVPSEMHKDRIANRDMLKCPDCNSNLMYVEVEYGIVAEDFLYGVMGNKTNRTYTLREISFSLYCSECASFVEDYSKFYHDDEEIVFSFRGAYLDDDDKPEIEYCLNQWNQKRDFEPRYKMPILNSIKEALNEHEKKYPEKTEEEKIKEDKK